MERNARIASWIMASHLRLAQLVCIHTYRHKNIRTYLHRSKVIDVVKHACLSVFCGGHVAVHLLWSTRTCLEIRHCRVCTCGVPLRRCQMGVARSTPCLWCVQPSSLSLYSGITPFPCPEDVV